MSHDAFVFSDDESNISPQQAHVRWKILSVEDDPVYQASLLHGLSGLQFRGQDVEVLTASSAVQAAEILAEHDDIAVMLLDVVMEQDDAGLRLVSSVREVLGNSSIRIVLLTGQPGVAPETDVMRQYDIDEYWNKADLNREKLHSVVGSHLRTWHYMMELSRAQRGLQLILDASRNLHSQQELGALTQAVLTNISLIIGAGVGGIVCMGQFRERSLEAAQVIASSGHYSNMPDIAVSDLEPAGRLETLRTASSSQSHQFRNDHSVLYFETHAIDGAEYLVLIDGLFDLTEAHINLLRVFSENIRSGFANVALLNRVSRLAYFDDFLGIRNRNGLLRELGTLNEKERREGVLLLARIKNFQDAMVTFGESYCESLLQAAAAALQQQLPGCSCFATCSTDSFAMIFNHSTQPDEARLLQVCEQVLMLSGVQHHIQLIFCKLELNLLEDSSPQEILHLAEITLSVGSGYNLNLIGYTPGYREKITSSHLLLLELQQALQNNELFIMLQPKVELLSQKPVGFEALVRWQKRDGNFIPPDVFIPLAETSGLIGSLDLHVLRSTFSAVQQLKAAGFDLPVSFNATVSDLKNRDYIQEIFNAIEGGQVNPQLLEIEVTESQAMADYRHFDKILRQFMDAGMGVSIDDFGTGYSSLSHITRLAATTLKIDRSFINGIENSEEDRHAVEMVAKIGQRFGYHIVAEGVETEAQNQWLQEVGCRIGQGYFFARPMTIDDAIAWLKSRP
ncbi:EAL domain-containing response regulator [Thalassolituus hydrocarboniclasticus]|uniref:EAL domain-containing protein n=1 Tax=Thalassolituus hydrocarboniclasticus TaxID=2742796 RepID=A0ABY6AC13_9GAMM|nr:EAL domain-containing protein [Thalassolituus hydrocarboniclasticus]UXD87821.1 EAL domain-containing protein [Thalassolituus hydrocarboniclasticus]